MNGKKEKWGKADQVNAVLPPFLFGLYVFIDALPELNQISILNRILIFLFIELCFGCTLIITSRLNEKKSQVTIMLCFILFTLGFFYNQFLSTVQYIFSWLPEIARHRYVMPFILIVNILLSWYLLTSKSNFSTLTNCLCIILFMLSAYSLFFQPNKRIDMIVETEIDREYHTPPITSVDGLGISYKPDIYYIVLDSFTGSESLKEFWNFDNEPFLKDLETRGFVISRKSKSLDYSSILSMASTLNMSSDGDYVRMEYDELFRRLRDSIVVKKIIENGYKINNYSLFELSGSPAFYPYFEYDIKNSFFTGIKVFMKNSIFWAFFEKIDSYAHDISITNQNIFSFLKKSDMSDLPQFTYAHIMMPHAPYGFDRNGNNIPPFFRKSALDKSAYLDQLIATEKFILEAVDHILSKYKENEKPIIIIQGDHGYRFLQTKADREKERYTILNAYFLPGGGNRYIYPTISPYNTFRIIFDLYFGEKYPLLNDVR